jgi:hypothetical protein
MPQLEKAVQILKRGHRDQVTEVNSDYDINANPSMHAHLTKFISELKSGRRLGEAGGELMPKMKRA